MSRIRANQITNQSADGAPTVQNGLVISGVTTSTTFSGSGASLTNIPAANITGTLPAISGANLTSLPAQATIANNADNRVITGGSGVNLTGEANLTFDGTSLLTVHVPSATGEPAINFTNSDTGTGTGNGFGLGLNSSESPYIWNRENTDLRIATNNTERLRIFSDGKFGFGTNSLSETTMAEFSSSTGGGAIGSNITIRNTSTNSVNNIAELRLKTAHGVARIFKYNTSETVFMSHSSGASDLIMQADGASKFRVNTNGSERLRITSDGKLTLNYAATPPSEDVMICTAGQASPGRLTLSHLSGGNRYGARLQSISGTNKGLIISELMNSSYTDLAKVNTEFGLKADNTCKAWLVYRSEAGNEGILDDFNVASVNDEGTGTFWVNLDRNIHRHGNGFSQSIVFGSYNASSYPFVASIGYAPSHGSNNPWWDVEDNGCRVQTQRSDTGAILDAKVFSLAMFGDTGDLSPT